MSSSMPSVSSSTLPPQAIFVPSNPNLPSDWKVGFGNRILPFVDVAAKVRRMGLSTVAVVSPFFAQAEKMPLFNGRNNICLTEKESISEILGSFEKVVIMDRYAQSQDYEDILKRNLSVAIVAPFSTHDRFDEENWRRAALQHGADKRPGAVYHPLDWEDKDQLAFIKECLQLKSTVSVPEVSFKTGSVKIQLFLRLGLYHNDRLSWVREEYPAKYFTDIPLGIPSGDKKTETEDPRMSLSLIIDAMKRISQEPGFEGKNFHMQICSDFSGTEEEHARIATYFQDNIGISRVQCSFETGSSIERDLYGAKEVDVIIGGSSDFLRIAAINQMEKGREKPLHIYMPKPDASVGGHFLQPNLRELECVVIPA